jgi:Bacterial Ig-like domain (group 3)/FG-GAP-like repeat
MNRPGALLLLLTLVVSSAGAAPIFRNPLPIHHGAQSADELLRADFNGDGHDDVLVVSPGDSLSVLIANGTGPFAAPQLTPIAAHTGRPAIADVNGDGKLDVVIADRDTKTVLPMLGNGDGTFAPGSAFVTTVPIPGPVAAGDFDGNGFADVAVASINDGSRFAVHFGNGTGQFSSGTETVISQHDGLRFLTAADLDADGKSDVIAADSFHNRVFLSNGDGTFTHTANLSSGGVAVADFNHDAKPDLGIAVTGIGQESYVEVALGHGNGLFQTPGLYAAGYGASSIETADVDGDGNADLLAASPTSSAVSVLRGKADGTFHAVDLFLAGPGAHAVAVADFDRDGALDFVTAAAPWPLDLLSFVRGKGDGTFHASRSFHVNSTVPVPWPGVRTVHPVTGDMNEDGHPDVVVIRERPHGTLGPYELAVLLNDGSGNLAAPILSDTQSTRWDWSPAFDLGDLNGDGWLDAVVISNPAYTARAVAMLGNGDGTFDPPVEFTIAQFGIPKLADFDGDGDVDLLLAGGGVTFYPGNGSGTFGAGVPSAVSTVAMRYGDVNGDGKLDFVSKASGSVTVVALNDRTGRFTQIPVTSEAVDGAALADFDGDGKTDLLCNAYWGTQMRFGNGDGTFRAPVSFTLSPAPDPNTLWPVATADFDGDGKIDAAFGTTIYLNDGNGGFRPGAEFRTYSGELAVADLDGSGSPDLVYVYGGADDVAVLLTRTTEDPTATTSLTLTANTSEAGYGERVRFEASVTGSGIPLTGKVVFSAGGRNLGIVAVNAEGTASFSTAFPMGVHTLTARYAGDEYHQDASNTFGVTVTRGTPVLLTESAPNPSRYEQTVSIRAFFLAPQGSGFGELAEPTGVITVRAGNTVLGTIPAGLENEFAPIEIDTLAVGMHVLKAEYPGDAHYEPVSWTFLQYVDKGLPALSIETTPAGHALLAGSPITLRARFSTKTPVTGYVHFYVDNVPIASIVVLNGVAETQTTMSWGSHTIRVLYSGDANWDPTQTSTSVNVKIGPWGTPLQVDAVGAGNGDVRVNWSQVQDAVSYKVWRRTSLANNWEVWNTYAAASTSISIPANTTYLFAVSAIHANGSESPLSTPDLATAIDFTDDPIAQRVTPIRAQHFLELRTAVAAVRTFAGLPAFAYTNAIGPGKRIRRADLTELRAALLEARNAIGLATLFTDNPPIRMRALHLTELRTAVQ